MGSSVLILHWGRGTIIATNGAWCCVKHDVLPLVLWRKAKTLGITLPLMRVADAYAALAEYHAALLAVA